MDKIIVVLHSIILISAYMQHICASDLSCLYTICTI